MNVRFRGTAVIGGFRRELACRRMIQFGHSPLSGEEANFSPHQGVHSARFDLDIPVFIRRAIAAAAAALHDVPP
jgi:hypothetical protein